MGPQVGGARDRRGRGESELWGSQVEGLMGWMTWLRRTQWQQGSSRTAFSPPPPPHLRLPDDSASLTPPRADSLVWFGVRQ